MRAAAVQLAQFGQFGDCIGGEHIRTNSKESEGTPEAEGSTSWGAGCKKPVFEGAQQATTMQQIANIIGSNVYYDGSRVFAWLADLCGLSVDLVSIQLFIGFRIILVPIICNPCLSMISSYKAWSKVSIYENGS